MPARTETFSLRLSNDVSAQVDQLARLTNRSRSVILEEAVSSYVREQGTYVTELEAAVASAASGHGHSSEQIFTWMMTWGTETEMPSPAPDLRPIKNG
jgi:predicted transcriptional regulator